MTAKQTVHEALRRYRNLCQSLRYGGLGPGYALAKQALEELDRLVEVEQLGLADSGTTAEVENN